MRANNGDHLHRYAGSSGGGGRGGREGEAYIVGGVGSGSDSSPWISCSAVRTISIGQQPAQSGNTAGSGPNHCEEGEGELNCFEKHFLRFFFFLLTQLF